MGVRLFGLHPTVPHHLVGIEGVLGYAHGVGHTAHAVVRLAAVVGVGVGEHDFHAAVAHTRACTGPLPPVVVPAAHHLDGHLVHVVVVLMSRFAAVERSVALGMVGVAPLVPVFAQSLVAAVLHGPHGVLVRLVDVEHLAAVFGFVDVEHFAAADGTSAVGVVGVAQVFHLQHVLARDALVAALIEKDRGVVAVVDDGVAHQGHTLLPAGALHVFLRIAGRHGLDESHAVARLDVLFPGRDVHPAHQVAVRLHHESVAVVAQPGRHAQSHAGPLVAGALGIAVHHEHTVVEPGLALAKPGLAEAGADDDLVVRSVETQRLLVGIALGLGQECLHGIEISVTPGPEVQALQLVLYVHGTGFARLQCHGLARYDGCQCVVGRQHTGEETESARPRILIAHLRLDVHHGLPAGDVVVGGVDISACGAEGAVERQGLIEQACNVQVEVLGQSAVVGIEIAVVPLVGTVVLPGAVAPVVVAAHSQHIVAFFYKGSEVETAGHHSVLGIAHRVTVEIHLGTLTGTLHFEKHLAVPDVLQLEVLAVPAYGVGMVYNVASEGLVPVEGVGQGDLLPPTVVKAGLFGFRGVADAQPPSAVEVVFLAVYGMACRYAKEKEANKEEERLSHIKMVCLQKNHGLTANVQKYLNFVLFSYLKLDEQSKNIAIFAKK